MKETRHYLALDGLRGVAALSVAFYHAGIDFGIPHFFSHGHLAVDFFFLLSGFVIAAAYEPRFKAGLTFVEFIRLRLIRLLPMIWLGVILGALTRYWIFAAVEPSKIIRSFLFIPTHSNATTLFPLNLVEWSLMFEVAINIIHALILWRLTNKNLVWLTGVAALTLVFLGFYFGSLDIGWSFPSWIGGISRVIFSYCLGILLWRYEITKHLKSQLPCLEGAGFLTLLFFIPGGGGNAILGPIRDLLSVLALMPALFIFINPTVSLNILLAKACKFLGDLSYPLYALHVPILVVIEKLTDGLNQRFPIRLGLTLISVAAVTYLSHLILKHADEPLRAWLRNKTKSA